MCYAGDQIGEGWGMTALQLGTVSSLLRFKSVSKYYEEIVTIHYNV